MLGSAAVYRKRGLTLIEVLVVVIILSVLVSIALPLYLKSVRDSEENTCKTNMSSIATAVQAHRVRTGGAYYTGPVDSAATAVTGPLQDLHNAVPNCPAEDGATYEVEADGIGFIVRCGHAGHTYVWRSGGFEN